MALKRNLIVQLDERLVKKAKVLAAQRDTSVTQLVADLIEDLVERDDAFGTAKKRALARLRKPIDLGGPPYLTREQIYDRPRARGEGDQHEPSASARQRC